MKIAGIICEYNPFHTGHAAHIAATRSQIGTCGAVICVMSPNFVQRGEIAILPKHIRAEAALRGGADLVIELPTEFATAGAERFARAGVELLAALNLPVTLSFASECGDVQALEAVAEALSSEAVNAAISLELKAGVSYARARERAVRAILGEGAGVLREPNNILGIEYIKAIKRLNLSDFEPFTVQRFGVSHDGGEGGGYASASRIREILRGGGSAEEYLPCPISSPVSDPSRLEAAFLYRFRTMTDYEFEALPDSGEGLWRRFRDCARSGKSVSEVIEAVKTKRYAHARIRRLALHSLLGITAEMQAKPPAYLRVLGFTKRGAEVLHEAKKHAALPIITKPADYKSALAFEARCTDIFRLALDSAAGSEWTTNPILI
ncbi:MAG: nucleotidyltransferase family protein [Oscillospiraceae bacterium]|nr:nucleotidyltransferase family protein [Oscillospiraceae bacterium]